MSDDFAHDPDTSSPRPVTPGRQRPDMGSQRLATLVDDDEFPARTLAKSTAPGGGSKQQTSKRILGMTSQERMVVSILIFIVVTLVAFFVLLSIGAVQL